MSWNRYSYAGNDPVNNVDPSGRSWLYAGSGVCTLGNGDYADNVECDQYYWQPNAFMPEMGDGEVGAEPLEGGGGSGSPTVTNVKPLSTPLFGELAGSLSGTPCGQWFQAGLTTSGVAVAAGETLSDFLTNYLPGMTASGDFQGGNANAVQTNAYSPYEIIFNNAGAFFNAIPQGQSIGQSNDYTSQFAAIQGGSTQAQVFLMLHELAHLFDMIRANDTDSTANQAFNNDEIWLNCSSVIQSFPNQGH